MAIEVDFGTELGTVVFPEDYTQEQVFDFVKQNKNQIRQNLIQRRQEEMAGETSQLEAAKYRAGDYGTLETIGGVAAELPKAITEGLGGAMKGAERLGGMVPARQFNPFTGQIGAQIQPQVPAGEGALAKAGQAVQEFGRETFPSLPGVQESIPAQIAGGVGSTLSVLPGALVAGPVGAGALYGLSAGESGAEDARRVINKRIAERLAAGDTQGANDLQAQASQLENQAFLLNAPIGAITEGALGVAGKIRYGKSSIGGVGTRLAERLIPKSTGARTQRMIRGGVEGAVTEGLQESLEQTMGNMAAKVTYDPERGIMDGVAQAGFIGAATGGLVGGIAGSERNPNLATANAVAEATGADPSNPLPRSSATVSGLQDGQPTMGPISIEPEITAEDVLRMSQEAGIPMPEAPAPAPAKPTEPQIDVVRLDQLRLKANAGTIQPDELAELTAMHQQMGIPAPAVSQPAPAEVAPAPAPAPVTSAETGLTPDEQAELDDLITAEDAGTLSEEDAITLSAYRARLGYPEPATQPQPTTPSAIQEQGPDEGVLRREIPQPPVEVGLRQVDQGGRPAEGGRTEAEGQAQGQAEGLTPLTDRETKDFINLEAQAMQWGSDYLTPDEQQRYEELGWRIDDLRKAGWSFDEQAGWTAPGQVLAVPAAPAAPTPEKAPDLNQVQRLGKLAMSRGETFAQAAANLAEELPRVTDPDERAVYEETIRLLNKEAAKQEAQKPAPAPATKPESEIHSAKLPKELAGAKPRYNFATAVYQPTFASDFDRAAFILAQTTPSKRDSDYLAWAKKVSGLTENQIRQHGNELRFQMRQQVRQTPGGTQQKPAALLVAQQPITAVAVLAAAAARPTVTAPAVPTPAPAKAPVQVPKTARDLAEDLALLRAQKPRPIKKLYGPNPTEKQKEAYKTAMSDWNKQYRKVAQLHKRTLDQENANRTSKVRPASPGEQTQSPAAAATPMQEGIDNIKYVSEPVAQARGGGMDAKDAKEKLVQQLERAVEAAPADSDQQYRDLISAGQTDLEERFKTVNDKNMGAGFEAKYRKSHELGKQLLAKYGPNVPKVTIEIPGDGTYTVANTKQALNQVLDKARKLNTSMAKGPVRAPAAARKPERPKEALMRMAKQATQVYGKNAAVKLREQADNADLDLTDEQRNDLRVVADMLTPTPKAKPLEAAKPDTVEATLQKVIAATSTQGKSFEAVAALSNAVLHQAAIIALRIYKATKSWISARNAGMDYIKSHVQLSNESETAANFEEFIKGFPNQEIPAGAPEPPQPPSPTERVQSRGIFRGEINRDTDANWQAEARKWVDSYKGNLERAYQAFIGSKLDLGAREYIGEELLARSELEVARAKNDIDLLRALDFQTRIADALVKTGSDFGKLGRARQMAFARNSWMVPQLVYRRLVREEQQRKIPFPEITATQVREWLVESGQQAIDQVKEAMKQADNVFAREFRKIKQVPGEAGGPPIEIKWREILTKSLQTQGSVRQKMLQVILADPRLKNLSPAGIAEITNLLTNAWEKKRDQIFRSEFAKKIPLPTVKPDAREKLFRSIPRILKYANIARATPGEQITTDGPETFLLWDQAFRDAVAPEFGVAEINGLTARKITELAQKAQAAEGVNRNEIIQQMFRLMAREGGVRFSDVLRDYWYAAVLSGTRTQLDNALNILNGALNTIMLSGRAGKQGAIVARSALKGLNEGIRDFWPMLWRGELYRSINFNPDQPGNALEGLGESRNLFAKGISQAKYVSRLMQALDHVTAMMSDAAAKAYALNKEMTPEVVRNLMFPDDASVKAARDRAIAEGTRPELVNKRTREILQEKFPVDVLMTSKDIREAITFTEVPQGVMGSLYEGLNAMSRKFPALKFLTGTNFVRFAANYTNEILNYAAPIAAYRWYQSAPGKSGEPGALQYSPARRDLLIAKASLGTALGAFAAALFLGDDDKEKDRDIDITGSFKSLDPNKRKQLLAEGRQPYSIRVGNTYISYRQLGFGGLLGAIGELRDRQLFEPEKWNQEGIIGKVQDAATAGLFIVKDSSAISGLTEFLGFANAYKYDTNEIIEKSAPRYLARLGGSFIPNILKEVDAWSDPSIFKAEPGGLGHEYFLQQVPFARRDIGPGPILNVLGEPVRVERYPYSRWVTQRQEDPAWNTLGQLASKGVFMPTPAITVKVNDNGKRREMTREEKYAYQRAVGQGYRKFIEQNRERLLSLPPAEAADFIDKNADRIRRIARTNLKNSF